MMLQNPHIPPSQLPHYRTLQIKESKRRRKRKRRRRLKRGDDADDSSSSSSDDDEEATKPRTAEQIQAEADRQERQRLTALRKLEWESIRKKWRTRRLDLRNEPDVGGAIRAAVVWHSQHTPKKNKSKQNNRSHGAVKDQVDVPDEKILSASVDEKYAEPEPTQVTSVQQDAEEQDETEEEPKDFHSRLLKTSQEATDTKHDKTETIVQINLEPFQDRMDFWELGSTHPKHIDPSLYRPAAFPKLNGPRQQQRDTPSSLDNKYSELTALGAHLHPLAPGEGEDREDHLSLVPRFHKTTPNARLQHKRQILRLVARYMFAAPPREGAKGKEVVLTNRMLRSLWNPSMLEATSFSLVDQQARWCGMRIAKFLGHNVQDDARVAMETMEITRDIRMLATTTRQTKNFVAPVKLLPRKETQMKASSDYVAVPGTEPPPPQRPLISVGFEFGPTDKFNFVWQKERVPEEAMRISLSILFARWLSSDEEDGQRTEYEHQMSTMMERVVRLNDSKLRRLLNFNKAPVDDLPILRLYQSLMAFCSLFASNGGHSFAAFAGPASSEVGRSTGMQAAALQMFHFLEQSFKFQGLNAFPRIHLIFALLRISTGLPEEAISIIAGALGGKSSATPFSIIRQVLEHLENEDLLLEGSSTDGQGIEVGKLEYLFFQASESVLRSIEADPIEPERHSWYIAIKAGSLLLCSGNRIGAGARLCPSARTKKNTDDVLYDMIEERKLEELNHEVRPKLNKFDETRLEIARALELLMNLTKFQDSARCHSAVSSFLEWGEAVALLVGNSEQMQSHFTEIRRMHEAHRHHWAIREQSQVAVEYLKRVEGSQRILSILADYLERYPGEVVNWRRLARALGAIPAQDENESNPPFAKTGESSDSSSSGESSDSSSAESSPVDMEESSDGRSCSESLKHDGKASNWYSSRESWWLEDFLYVPIPDFLPAIRNHPDTYMQKKRPLELKGDLFALRTQALSYLEENTSLEKCGGFFGMAEGGLSPNYDSIGWLKACLLRTTSETYVPPEQRSKQYDHLLPVPLPETLDEPPDINYKDLGRPFPSLEKVGPKMEATFCRLLIRCHVNTQADPLVVKAIKYYLCIVWDVKGSILDTNHECWHALVWLYSMGVDILAELPETRMPTKDEIDYPPKMRKAVMAHVKKVGPRHWNILHTKKASIFKGLHKHKARFCYKFLLRKGLIDPDKVKS
eukprot:scaffold1019_cov172-Amphora_coffeaeformis.AAC.19